MQLLLCPVSFAGCSDNKTRHGRYVRLVPRTAIINILDSVSKE